MSAKKTKPLFAESGRITRRARPLFPEPRSSNVVPLHVVRRGSRPSVIVDVGHGETMTCPWSVAEMHAMYEGRTRIPHAVMQGMWIAAWARAEHCGLLIERACLQPHCRFQPSDALYAALGSAMVNVVGALGFAVPIMLDDDRRASAASWPVTMRGAEGTKWGTN